MMTTETSQIETVSKVVAQVYRNENHPKGVIQTIDGERFSDYDGSKIPDSIRAESEVDITYKQNGEYKNIVKVSLNPNKDVIKIETPESQEEYLDAEATTYAYIYKQLVSKGIPQSLANTSASTIYIQFKRSRKL